MSAPIVTPVPAAAFDVEAVRAQFLVLAQQIRGKHPYTRQRRLAQPEVVVQRSPTATAATTNIHRGACGCPSADHRLRAGARAGRTLRQRAVAARSCSLRSTTEATKPSRTVFWSRSRSR